MCLGNCILLSIFIHQDPSGGKGKSSWCWLALQRNGMCLIFRINKVVLWGFLLHGENTFFRFEEVNPERVWITISELSMVLKVTLDWVIGQDILDRCNDQTESVVSDFPFLSFAYLGVQQARSCSTYFFVSAACYTTLYFSFPTELTSKEYLLFKDFFLLFCLFCIHSELGQIKKFQTPSNLWSSLPPQLGNCWDFQCQGQCHAIFPGRPWKSEIWGTSEAPCTFWIFFYFLPKPEQIGGIRAFWLAKYWTEHVFTKLKFWIYC